ncbi:hypothetical protein V8F33_014043 [Rhypophila sp. PSN 637]
MVGISQTAFPHSTIPLDDREALRILDILDALSLDPNTLRPHHGCSHRPQANTPTRKMVFQHVEHILPFCHPNNRSRKNQTPAYTLIVNLKRLLFPTGIKSFEEALWEDICSRGKKGYKRTWVCCDAISNNTQDTQALASRKKPPTREQCRYCDFTCSTGELDGHMHDQHRCPYCPPTNCYEGPSLKQHLRDVHLFVECHGCVPALSSAHLSSPHPGRRCPCGMTICQESAIDHLIKHPFVYCGRGCKQNLTSDWDSHLRNLPSSRCRVRGCEALFMGIGFLRAHLMSEHYFRPREDCCCMDCLEGRCVAHPNGWETAWQHILRHDWTKCPDPGCGLDIQRSVLTAHLYSHGWVSCELCGGMEPNAEALDAHLLSHPLCRICNRRFTHVEIDQHLLAHDSTPCPMPSCKKIVKVDLLPRHFATCHDKTELCPEIECEEVHSKSGLRQHLIDVHHWPVCTTCQEPVHPGSIFEHKLEKHGGQPSPAGPETRPRRDSTLPPSQTSDDPELDALLQKLENDPNASLAPQFRLLFEARSSQPSRKRSASGPTSASKKIARPSVMTLHDA